MKNDGIPHEWEKVLEWMERTFEFLPEALKSQIKHGIPNDESLLLGKRKPVRHGLTRGGWSKHYHLWTKARERAREEQR